MASAHNTLRTHSCIVLVIISILAVLWLQAPRLWDQFQADEDFRTFYWMSKFYDSELFPNEPRPPYISFQLLSQNVIWYFPSPAYGWLFNLASFLVTPIFFVKLLPFIVMPITVWYLFKFGESVRDRGTGLVLALSFIFLNLISSTSISVITGLQRSFATSFIIILVYYLHRQKYLSAALVALLSSLIYAPAFALGAAIWGLFALRIPGISLKAFFVQRGGGLLLATVVLGGLILIPAFFPLVDQKSAPNGAAGQEQPAEDKEPSAKESLFDSPDWQENGIHPLFYLFPLIGRGGIVHDDIDGLHLAILLALSGLIVIVRGRRSLDLPYVVWCILGASLGMYVLAWLVVLLTHSFLLYLPSRYTQVGLFVFFVMFVSFNIRPFVPETLLLFKHHHRRLIWLIIGVEILVLGLLFLYPSERTMMSGFNVKWLLGPAGLLFGVLGIMVVRKPTFSVPDLSTFHQTRGGRYLIAVAAVIFLTGWLVYAPAISQASFLNPDPAERELMQFLETLPKDTLIAGTPCALGSVPLFAKRQVLFSCEKFTDDAIMREALDAYYSPDKQVVNDFCLKYDIDTLVVDSRFYSKYFLDNGLIFFEPYNQELLPRVTNQTTFALAQVPDEAKLFQSEDLFVISCDFFEGNE